MPTTETSPVLPRERSGIPEADPHCPICRQATPVSVRSMDWKQLDAAWRAVGINLSMKALESVKHASKVQLWQCRACGFEYSDPALAGNARFYEELQAQMANYYPVDSLEYFRAVQFARDHGLADVLDVGCGSGNFLTMMKGAGLKTFGAELNPKGAELARRSGHEVFDCLLDELLRRPNRPSFSFVTAWQVLEHVSDPVQFLTECAALVKPGGYVAVAVPFEDGVLRLCPFNPYMWPPHHVTRWRLKDLKHAGEKAGLQFVSGGVDELYGATGKYFWDLHNRIVEAIGQRPHPGGKWLPAALSFLYRKAGLRHFLPNWGPSVYAFYTRK